MLSALHSLPGQPFPVCHLGAWSCHPPLGPPRTLLPTVCCQIHSLLSYTEKYNSSLCKPRRPPLSDPNRLIRVFFLAQRVLSQRHILTYFQVRQLRLWPALKNSALCVCVCVQFLLYYMLQNRCSTGKHPMLKWGELIYKKKIKQLVWFKMVTIRRTIVLQQVWKSP